MDTSKLRIGNAVAADVDALKGLSAWKTSTKVVEEDKSFYLVQWAENADVRVERVMLQGNEFFTATISSL